MKIPKHLDEAVRTRAKHRCEYCQAAEMLTGQRFHVDHIIPRALGGETSSVCGPTEFVENFSGE